MAGLGDIPGGDFLSRAWGVSADGNTVVGESISSIGQEAFRWTIGGGMAGLGELRGGPFGGFVSRAIGVSADGNTVVGHGRSTFGFEAFIWKPTQNPPMRGLREVLINDHGLSQVSGWRLDVAYAVSADGLVIVGVGRNPSGQIEAWRAVLGRNNTGPIVSCPESATEECVSGGAEFTIVAEVFDADGDDLTVQWDVTLPDGSVMSFYDVVSFGSPPAPVTIQLNGGPHFFPLGSTSVSVCVNDHIVGRACCSPITVTVEDTTNPIISTLVQHVEVGTDPGECFATVDLNSGPYVPVFSDLCSPDITATNDAPATFPLGETVVTWTVSDGAGNSIYVTQTIIVSDDEAPTATAPADIVVAHDTGQFAASGVDLGMPVANDNCGVASIINDAIEPFPLGDTEVTWYISDAAGNTIMVTQKVTVTNEDPIADAGLDFSVNEGQTAVMLDGSASQ